MAEGTTHQHANVGPPRALVAAIVAALLEQRRRQAPAWLVAPRSPWRMAGRQRALRSR